MRRTLVAEYVRRGVMFGSAPCGADVMMEGLIAGFRRVCKLVDGFFEEKTNGREGNSGSVVARAKL